MTPLVVVKTLSRFLEKIFLQSTVTHLLQKVALAIAKQRHSPGERAVYSVIVINVHHSHKLYFLFRLSENQEQNKMGQNNLATVFGPNILRPSSSSGADPTDLAQGTLDVMSQVGIFLWFIKCTSLQLPSDPALMHRLDPGKTQEIVIAPDPSEKTDRLI